MSEESRKSEFHTDAEPGAVPATSGQNVPKSGDTKFREKSNVQNPSERLHQGADASSFADNAKKKQVQRIQKSTYRAERTGAKLETATKKRDNKKPQKAPGVIKSVRRMAQFELYRYAHGKIYQSEHENAGVEAAHRTEIAGERVAGTTKRFIQKRNRTRPARRVQKWTKRDVKAKADLAYTRTDGGLIAYQPRRAVHHALRHVEYRQHDIKHV